MSLSGEQRSELSALERVLAGDQTLSAVAELFPEPVAPPPAPVDDGHDTPPTRRARAARAAIRVGILSAIASLVLVAVSAALNLPIMVAIGIVAWICGATTFVVGASLYTGEPWRAGLLLPRRRSAPRQPTRPAAETDRDTSV